MESEANSKDTNRSFSGVSFATGNIHWSMSEALGGNFSRRNAK